MASITLFNVKRNYTDGLTCKDTKGSYTILRVSFDKCFQNAYHTDENEMWYDETD